MQIWFWKESLVPDAETALHRARTGAAWLESKYGPGWHVGIDAERLDIAHPFRCILGQLHQLGTLCMPSIRRAVDGGMSCGLATDLASLVIPMPRVRRSFALLTEAWRVVLAEVRIPTTTETGEPAVEARSEPAHPVRAADPARSLAS